MQYAPETTELGPGFLKTHQVVTCKKKKSIYNGKITNLLNI